MKKLLIMITAWGLLNIVGYLFAFENGYLMSWGVFGILLVCSGILLILVTGMIILIGVFELLSVNSAY